MENIYNYIYTIIYIKICIIFIYNIIYKNYIEYNIMENNSVKGKMSLIVSRALVGQITIAVCVCIQSQC